MCVCIVHPDPNLLTRNRIRGRVSDWLPGVFDDEKDVKIGDPVRLLSQGDNSSRRNRFQWGNLVTGIVVPAPDEQSDDKDHFYVQVQETLTKQFVIMGTEGVEVKLLGHNLILGDKLTSQPDVTDPYVI